jgi:hypothetical protein
MQQPRQRLDVRLGVMLERVPPRECANCRTAVGIREQGGDALVERVLVAGHDA